MIKNLAVFGLLIAAGLLIRVYWFQDSSTVDDGELQSPSTLNLNTNELFINSDTNPEVFDAEIAGRGESAFYAYGCWRCHSMGNDEVPGMRDELNLGPDLEDVGHRLSGHQIMEAIIFPNSTIAEPRELYSIDGLSRMPSFNDPAALKDINDIVYFLQHSKVEKKPSAAKQFHHVADQSYKEVIKESQEVLLFYFWAEWCFACHEIEPALVSLVPEFSGKVKFCKIAIDDNPLLIQEFVPDLQFPCMVMIKQGKVLDRIYGAQGQDDLEEFFRKWINSKL